MTAPALSLVPSHVSKARHGAPALSLVPSHVSKARHGAPALSLASSHVSKARGGAPRFRRFRFYFAYQRMGPESKWGGLG